MPLGKYYCDYCDKQFQDTPSARRRHLQGVAHQRAKALWYDAVRSSSQPGLIQVEDPLSIGKGGVCNRFVRTVKSHCSYPPLSLSLSRRYIFLEGSCQYGDSCKYYHPKKNVPNLNAQGMEGMSFSTNVQSHGPSSLLHGESSFPAALFGNQMGTSLGNLPPSLWPPPEGGYPPMPFIDWG